ncbi:SWIM zinc finger family protein [Pseudonocardia sp. DSM 110487]|uniref:SWIM zinc finger family protein n=1 Tax=Pseudonocardia sp. DSM 110487 TaxID=2865833 RepID=UPI001C6A8B56|nr:SWIM zinc finger family protein [Pseudonocardia sp. DSM 110487]QYN32038.1 SWIM zinc finger family protein [Pseudonocardia sp. DSM 110487]
MPDPDPFWWRDAEPSRPRKVEGGIQIHSTRGQVARTWWSQRFLSVLESLGVGGRLSRGRSYARAGQIVSLTIDVGGVVAQVQGSRPQPYQVRLGVPAFGKAEWAAVAQALADEAAYAAALLNGEMPRDIERVFEAVGLSLFPANERDLAMDCSCPDYAVPCKHLAAVCYVLAERFDADPFQILAMRGRHRDALLEELRTRRSAAPPPAHGEDLSEVMDRFWVGGDVPEQFAGPRTPPDALLDQVPPFPIEVRGEQVAQLLRPAYRALGAEI